ncbi:MAG: hypothetical protein AVDCRST_MAG67-1086, partial [uncultured Solirubrobacteraceae bacterium]
ARDRPVRRGIGQGVRRHVRRDPGVRRRVREAPWSARLRDRAQRRKPAAQMARRRAELPGDRARRRRLPDKPGRADPEVPLVGLHRLRGHDLHLHGAPRLRQARQAAPRPGAGGDGHDVERHARRPPRRLQPRRGGQPGVRAPVSRGRGRAEPRAQGASAAQAAARQGARVAEPRRARADHELLLARPGPDVGTGHHDLRVRAAGDPRRDRRRAPSRCRGADRLPRGARRRADADQRGACRRVARDTPPGTRHEQHLPRQVHGLEPHRQRAAHARGGALRLDELHAQRRLPAGKRRAHRQPAGAGPEVPGAVRDPVQRQDGGRDTQVDQRQQPAVLRCADRRRLLAAQRGGRPRPVRGGDPRRRARRPVLHGLQAQRPHPRRAQGQAQRRDPALRAAEHRRRADHRHPPRPHRRLRRDGVAVGGPGGLSQGDQGGPGGQHPDPYEARRDRFHLRRADGHQRIAQPVGRGVEVQRRELPHHPRRDRRRRLLRRGAHAALRPLPLPLAPEPALEGSRRAGRGGGSDVAAWHVGARRPLDEALLRGRNARGGRPRAVRRGRRI